MHISAWIILFLIGAMMPARAQAPTGEWLVEDGYARIRIVDCRDALWGIVAWEQTPGGRDVNNPDASKQSRPTLGMPILLRMRPASRGRWEGQIYNSENGRTYEGSIALRDANTLRVEGCVLGFLCGGQDWTRQSKAPSAGSGSGGQRVTASDAQICSSVLGASGRAH
jgi:uncharacterized protein (DUF2147 family)